MSVIMYLINKRVKHGNICWIFQTEDSQSDYKRVIVLISSSTHLFCLFIVYNNAYL